MGLFSWLFGSPKPERTPEELQALEEERARKHEELSKSLDQDIVWAKNLDIAHKILSHYGGVLEDTIDAGWAKSPKILLHPESALPYPKNMIRWAFAIFFDELERSDKEVLLGMPKDALILTAMALEQNFAPDEEIPDNSKLNIQAYMEWQTKIDPERRRREEVIKKKIKENPEAAKALASAILKTFDGEWEDYFKLRGFLDD